MSLFFNKGHMFARDHSLEMLHVLVSTDCWERRANTGPNSVTNPFGTLGWSSTGPMALDGSNL